MTSMETFQDNEKLFTCDICEEQFAYENSLLIHRQIHLEKKPFSCDLCEESFLEEYALKYHKSFHEEKKKKIKAFPNTAPRKYVKKNLDLTDSSLECKICGKILSTKYTLQNHILNHSNDRPFECSKCYKNFQTEAYLSAHMRIHSNGSHFSCPTCHKIFASKSGYNKHLRNVCGTINEQNKDLYHAELAKYPHTKNSDTTFTCDVCSKTFQSDAMFERHAMVHSGERPYECDICFLGFKTQKYLNYHHELHSKARSYSCNVCSRVFTTYRNCCAHRLTHKSKEKVSKPGFKCTQCSRQFKTQGNYTRHMVLHSLRMVPKKPSTKPPTKSYYPCSSCDKRFMTKSGYNKHVRKKCSLITEESELTKYTHNINADYTYTRNICSKTFRTPVMLQRHAMVRTGYTPYKCDVCSAGFSSLKYLQGHKEIHSDSKSYSCSKCSQVFKTFKSFLVHKLIHRSKISVLKTRHKCGRCVREFKTQSALARHSLIHSFEVNSKGSSGLCCSKRFRCSTCHKKFVSKYGYNRHFEKCRALNGSEITDLENYPCVKNSDNTYTCTICFKNFPSYMYVQHAMLHTGETPFECDTCFLGFKKANDLKLHKETRHETKLYSCSECYSVLKTYKAFLAHKLIHRSKKNVTRTLYKCGICFHEFRTRDSIKKHFEIHNNTDDEDIRYSCCRCSEVFLDLLSFERHYQYKHLIEGPYKCEICFLELETKQMLADHLEMHDDIKPYLCEKCSKTFIDVSAFRKHCLLHDSVINMMDMHFECDKCFLKFETEELYTKHIQTHSIVKTYTCKICSEDIAGDLAFKKHSLSHASNISYEVIKKSYLSPRKSANGESVTFYSPKKPHICLVCSEKFIEIDELNAHVLAHKSEELSNYQSNVCCVEFGKEDLSSHLEIACDKKPNFPEVLFDIQHQSNAFEQITPPMVKFYNCDLCLIHFKTKKALARHFHLHSSNKSYSCSICSKRFSNSKLFRKHSFSHKTLFSCNRCSETFVHEGALLSHYNVHLHRKPFVCNICKESYSTHQQLREHSSLHTHGMP